MEKHNFILNETLKNDTFFVSDLKLCKILLMNRIDVPWFILVPKVPNIKEIFELSNDDSITLMNEISFFSKLLNEIFSPDKINVAALGNVVPQLHIHIIARYKNDSAWPSPVFGKLSETPYNNNQKDEIIKKIKNKL